jgi:hypothetical protein
LGVPGAFPNFDSTQDAHAQKEAKRRGHSERSGEVPPLLTMEFQLAPTPKKAKPSAATRASSAEKGRRWRLPRLRYNTARL